MGLNADLRRDYPAPRREGVARGFLTMDEVPDAE